MFRRLRAERGFFARMNYACCGGCASYEANQDARAGQPVAYMHAQDMEAFDGDHLHEDGVYVGFGVAVGDGNPAPEEDVEAVGQIIAQEAKRVGLRVDWDGTAARRVVLMPMTLADAVGDALDRMAQGA